MNITVRRDKTSNVNGMKKYKEKLKRNLLSVINLNLNSLNSILL